MIRIQRLEECYFDPLAALGAPFKEAAHHFSKIDLQDSSTLKYLGYGILLVLPVINWIALAIIFRTTDIATIKNETLKELKEQMRSILENHALSEQEKCEAMEKLCLQPYAFHPDWYYSLGTKAYDILCGHYGFRPRVACVSVHWLRQDLGSECSTSNIDPIEIRFMRLCVLVDGLYRIQTEEKEGSQAVLIFGAEILAGRREIGQQRPLTDREEDEVFHIHDYMSCAQAVFDTLKKKEDAK